MVPSEVAVLTCVSLTLALALAAPARPDEFDYEYPDVQPVFLSRPASYSVRDGDSIVLPCEINDLGPYPVVWKKGRRVISAGKTITAIDRRFRLVGQHDLEITRVRVKDAGTFTCSVSTEPLMELTHTVDILYGATVTTVPDSGLVVTRAGADQTLECRAHGKPEPKLFWRKQTGRLPSGDETQAGARITISGVSRQMAGVYECVADNGVGAPAVGRVSLQVHYAPEVEVERTAVHTGEGYRVKLICFVFADPPAQVMWAREGSSLDPTRHIISEDVVMGTRHILTIRSVQRDDFDTYTCSAQNGLGATKGRMIVTGVADRVEVTSPSVGSAPDAFDLAWRVQSHSPVLEYKVAFRTSKLNSSSEQPSPWKEVIVPTTGTEPVNEIQHHQKITLRHLRPATTYDLYIQASNRHGWNAVSDTFHFSTLARGEALESRIARAGGPGSRKLHPVLGAATVLAFVILPVLF